MASSSEALKTAFNYWSWLTSCRSGTRVPTLMVIPHWAPAAHAEAAAALPSWERQRPLSQGIWAAVCGDYRVGGILETERETSELKEGSKFQENGKQWLKPRVYNLHVCRQGGPNFQ